MRETETESVVKLPGGDEAVVDAAKVCDYLLSPMHPVGRWKSHFFRSLGFTQERWPELKAELLALARHGDAEMASITPFGQKYTIRDTIEGLNGRTAALVSIWIVPKGEVTPRFVTAFPGDRR